MREKEWVSFEKSGRVSDYLTYCQSSTGKFSEFGADTERCERQDGADLSTDATDNKACAGLR
ncbi:MAG: hypothetical protein LIO75_00185, partial [Lachnospiraceae bacterium]|nr:hypothetical protein [Lachnospiraceae bacterium]